MERPCLGKGASQGEESALADSGREGVITAGVGRVRCLDFLSILMFLGRRSLCYISTVFYVYCEFFRSLLGQAWGLM